MNIPFGMKSMQQPIRKKEHSKSPSFTKKGPGRYHRQGGLK